MGVMVLEVEKLKVGVEMEKEVKAVAAVMAMAVMAMAVMAMVVMEMVVMEMAMVEMVVTVMVVMEMAKEVMEMATEEAPVLLLNQLHQRHLQSRADRRRKGQNLLILPPRPPLLLQNLWHLQRQADRRRKGQNLLSLPPRHPLLLDLWHRP
jgi:hypothetical protein